MTLWHVHLSIYRQAARDFSRLSPIGEVITASSSGSGGGDDVPSHVAVNRSTPIKLKAGQAVDIQWDTESVDTAGVFKGTKADPVARLNLDNAYYVSTFTASVKGLASPASSVHTAIVFCDLSGNNTGQAPWVEHPTTNNTTLEISDVRSYKAGNDRGIKIRIKAPADCTLDALQWRVHFWRL